MHSGFHISDKSIPCILYHLIWSLPYFVQSLYHIIVLWRDKSVYVHGLVGVVSLLYIYFTIGTVSVVTVHSMFQIVYTCFIVEYYSLYFVYCSTEQFTFCILLVLLFSLFHSVFYVNHIVIHALFIVWR